MKNYLKPLISIVIFLVLLPWVVPILFPVNVPGYVSMLVMYLLIWPGYFIGLGIFAGRDIRVRWFWPVLAGSVYLTATHFLWYGTWAELLPIAWTLSAYLLFCFAAMGVTVLVRRAKGAKRPN